MADFISIYAEDMLMVMLYCYTDEFEPLFYNYLKPLSTLDEGLYALAYEEDVHCLATLVGSFKLVEVYINHGFIVVNSYQRPPLQVMATLEDISEPRTSHEYRSDKMLLLTWHNSSTPGKDSVCEFVTPRYMPHGMLTPPTDVFVITYTQLSGVQGVDTQDHVIIDVIRQLSFEKTNLDGEAGFGDVVGSGIDSSGLSHDESFRVDDLDLNVNLSIDLNVSQTKTKAEVFVSEVLMSEEAEVGRTEVPVSKEAGRIEEHVVEQDIVKEVIDGSYEEEVEHGNDQEAIEAPSTDNADDDLMVYEKNEIIELDVDVHLFGIRKDVPFDNISVTNLVPDDVLEGEDVNIVNSDGFNSDTENMDVRAERHGNWTSKRMKLCCQVITIA
ncbi:hypothetical protein Tco_0183521 [Tanacetum coccineum]